MFVEGPTLAFFQPTYVLDPGPVSMRNARRIENLGHQAIRPTIRQKSQQILKL